MVVHVFWYQESQTYLPLEWRDDPDDEYPDPPTEELAIGLVGNNHFVVLHMEPEHPISNIFIIWKRNKEPRLAHWLEHYKPRIDAWTGRRAF